MSDDEQFRKYWLDSLFTGQRIPAHASDPNCLTTARENLPGEIRNRRATIGTFGVSSDVLSVGPQSRAPNHGPRFWANKFLRKPRQASIHMVSRNLDAFFECFSAHHALIDPLSGRFNLSSSEHVLVVSYFSDLAKDRPDKCVSVSHFENPSLAQKWSYTSKGVLSLLVCQRVVHLARIYAVNGRVNVQFFIEKVLRVRRSEWIDKLLKAFLKTAVILLYYVVGCLFYGYYMDLTIVSSIYFITCTVSTLGPGDIVPIDDFSRLFTLFYAVVGILLILGIIVGQISDILSGYQERVKSVGGGIIEVTSVSKRRRRIAALYALHIFYATMLVIFPVVVGTLLIYYTYGPTDSMSLVTCIYTAGIICMSIGYGDFVPTTDLDRMLISMFIYLGISCFSAAIVQIGSLNITIDAYRRQELLASKRLAVALIAQLDSDENGVDKFEFLAAMLVALEKVCPREISDILHQFDEMDLESKGVVSLQNLLEHNAGNGLVEDSSESMEDGPIASEISLLSQEP